MSGDDKNGSGEDGDGMGFDFIEEGDWVEHKLNPQIFGIVIGTSGLFMTVQIVGSLAIQAFHEATLRYAPWLDPEFGDEKSPESTDESNVIDFTKAREVQRDTKTEGAA